MSAFIVGNDHIDFLVTAAIDLGTNGDYGIYWNQPGFHQPIRVGLDNADEFGAMLLGENIASVQYRYPHDEYSTLPGPIPTPFAFEYRFRRFSPFRGREIETIVQIFSALACYEYQSCEHPGWNDSEAKRICDNLRRAYISRLPGYEDAEWEVSRAPRPTYA